MKKLCVLCLLVAFLVATGGAGYVFGDTIKAWGTPPTVSGTGNDKAINDAIADAFAKALGQINENLTGIDANPSKFIGAWANSSVYTSTSVSQRGYQDYDLFGVTLGSMIGVQLPGSPFKLADDMQNLSDTLNQDHDIRLGANVQLITGQVGINTSKFLLKNLYLGLKFGMFNMNISDVSMNTLSLGVVGNYQIFSGFSVLGGLFRWRGLNVGTGFIWQRSVIDINQKIDGASGSQSWFEPNSGLSGKLIYDPKLVFNMTTNTFTIPLEVTTAIKVLWCLNFTAGLGVDIGMGSTKMDVGINSPLTLTGVTEATPGSIAVNAGGKQNPTPFSPKIMGGFGFSIGPVMLDIPFTYYIGMEGYSVGVTLGVVW